MASNQHGVHSPFVYAYVTRCLYAQPHFKATKSVNVLLKSIAYFSATRCSIDSTSSTVEKRVREAYDLGTSEHKHYDLVYVARPSDSILPDFQNTLHNDSLILVDQIHRTRDAKRQWNTLHQDQRITVSIDLFHCGLLFFRREQVKEHFKIRI